MKTSLLARMPDSSLRKCSIVTLAAWLLVYLLLVWHVVHAAPVSTSNAVLHLQIAPACNSLALVSDSLSLTNAKGQLFSVTRLDFLLSDFAIRRTDGTWISSTNSQAFISLGKHRLSTALTNLPFGHYDRIRFHVGLSPELNHSNPAQYAPNHPLNPNLNNLHWGWSGGYVFFALEGRWQTADAKLSGYSWHLGNDSMLMTAEVPIQLSLSQDTSLMLTLNLDKLLSFELSPETSSTHSRPGDEVALKLRKEIEGAFSVANANPSTSQKDSTLPVPNSPNLKISTSSQATPYRFTISSQFPIPDLPRDNPLTVEGVELGQRLFNEKLLSVNNSQSCASCHHADAAFAEPGKRFSTGAEGQTGSRNAMPLFNLAWKKSFFWDGRAASLREQVLMPIQNPVEMHESLTNAVAKLSRGELYPSLFEKAFGTREISSDLLARALEQFLLAQVSFDSKFDHALEGTETFTDEEKRGFELFMTEYDPRHEQFGADCFHCHGGPFFTTHGFASNGLDSTFKDFGRYDFTKNEADKGKFAVPSLRNVEVTGPYMHDGRFKTLEEVVEHYSTGMHRSATLDPNLAKHPDGGVPLTTADKKALVAFLKTLTDKLLKPVPITQLSAR
jgi:cytochrome c peroxidase